MKGLSVRDAGPVDDAIAPMVRRLYPNQNGQSVEMVDAIVTEASDNNGLEWVDVVIDGKRQGMPPERDPVIRRLVFPLLARALAPGEHALLVRARDRAGNQSYSRTVAVNKGRESC
ncbi:MAG: hypothetical protein O3B24_06330 [Verrucomicrobia bacterium]|nr:hypothetical protein [Verrucomicrobiota bacterium]